jgi:hypothetical protein
LPFYAVPAREVLSQGDILQDIVLDEPRRKRLSRVIVLSHSCEIDKPQSKTLIGGEVFPLQREGKKYAGRIRTESNKIINIFYLPSTDGVVESYVDFRYLFRVYYADIGAEHWKQVGDQQHRTLADPEKRIASLGDEATRQLALKFAFFFVRPDLAGEEVAAIPSEPVSQ